MSTTKDALQVSLQQVKQRIAGYELKYAREPGSVQLLAVSKTQAADRVRTAHSCGQRCFGENYLQEALAKMETLVDLPLEWHFIGPIQSNKTRDIASNFDWVHSVDRLKIAQRGDDGLDVCGEPRRAKIGRTGDHHPGRPLFVNIGSAPEQ
jgi:pyridoxal phosphate enzyme (YggS family)